jgi:hypothetical protein
MPRKPTSNTKPHVDRYPCVFRDAFIRETIDPRVSMLWKQREPGPVPFGDFRRIWKYEHCRKLNPGGSVFCRFSREDCALAFFTAVQHALDPSVTVNPVGYYRRLALSMAIDRADRRPLEREVGPRDQGSPGTGHQPGPGGPDPVAGPGPVLLARDQDVSGEVPGVHGPRSRPVHIGDVLGSLNLGPHQGPRKDGSASGK